MKIALGYRGSVMSDDVTAEDRSLVLRAFELFNARDADGLVELMDPAGEFQPFAIEGRRREGYRGHEGLREYMRDVDAVFETFAVDVVKVSDMDGGIVRSDGWIRGLTRDGQDIEMAASWLWTCRGGKVAHMRAHPRAHAGN